MRAQRGKFGPSAPAVKAGNPGGSQRFGWRVESGRLKREDLGWVASRRTRTEENPKQTEERESDRKNALETEDASLFDERETRRGRSEGGERRRRRKEEQKCGCMELGGISVSFKHKEERARRERERELPEKRFLTHTRGKKREKITGKKEKDE